MKPGGFSFFVLFLFLFPLLNISRRAKKFNEKSHCPHNFREICRNTSQKSVSQRLQWRYILVVVFVADHSFIHSFACFFHPPDLNIKILGLGGEGGSVFAVQSIGRLFATVFRSCTFFFLPWTERQKKGKKPLSFSVVLAWEKIWRLLID